MTFSRTISSSVPAHREPATMLLSSASSKTAYGTAFQLAQRQGIEVVGLSVGRQPGVLPQPRLLSPGAEPMSSSICITSDAACVYVDFAGNAGLRQADSRPVLRISNTAVPSVAPMSSSSAVRQGSAGAAGNTVLRSGADQEAQCAEWGADVLGRRLLAAWRDFVGQGR
jgi:hypothetical protein